MGTERSQDYTRGARREGGKWLLIRPPGAGQSLARPVNAMLRGIAANGIRHGLEVVIFVKYFEEPVGSQPVLHWAFHLCKIQRDARSFQLVIKPGEHVSSGDVNIGDRLRGNDQPFRWLRRLCDTPSHVLAENLRIREKEWRIPANQ